MAKTEKPSYWSKEWYLDKKTRGYRDEEIAEDFLYVNRGILKQWKDEIGLKGFGAKKKCFFIF